jgi:hypothetical protein
MFEHNATSMAEDIAIFTEMSPNGQADTAPMLIFAKCCQFSYP